MNIKEELYVWRRKIKALQNTMISLLCSIWPINKNKIAVCTFEGKGGFGCNPRYIVEELHRRNENYEFVWIVNDTTKEFPDYIKAVSNTCWSRNYHLATSKLWINNYRNPYGTRKRKGQYYLQTWHAGIGFKNIGLWRGEAFSRMAFMVSKNDSDMIDCVIADSKWCMEMFPKGLLYDGRYEMTGAPRCSPLFGDRSKSREWLRKRFDIPDDSKIVLFAPTFRETAKNGSRGVYSEVWSIDLERMLRNFEKRFGGEWYLGIRVHPQLASYFEDYDDQNLRGRILNVSKDDDIYQIMPAIDALVTDYSSTAFEASLADIPVFLYADDLTTYVKSRGGLFWEFQEGIKGKIHNKQSITPGIDAVLPYSVAENNEELETYILDFDEDAYVVKLRKFENAMGILFDGKAAERAANIASEFLGR